MMITAQLKCVVSMIGCELLCRLVDVKLSRFYCDCGDGRKIKPQGENPTGPQTSCCGVPGRNTGGGGPNSTVLADLIASVNSRSAKLQRETSLVVSDDDSDTSSVSSDDSPGSYVPTAIARGRGRGRGGRGGRDTGGWQRDPSSGGWNRVESRRARRRRRAISVDSDIDEDFNDAFVETDTRVEEVVTPILSADTSPVTSMPTTTTTTQPRTPVGFNTAPKSKARITLATLLPPNKRSILEGENVVCLCVCCWLVCVVWDVDCVDCVDCCDYGCTVCEG